MIPNNISTPFATDVSMDIDSDLDQAVPSPEMIVDATPKVTSISPSPTTASELHDATQDPQYAPIWSAPDSQTLFIPVPMFSRDIDAWSFIFNDGVSDAIPVQQGFAEMLATSPNLTLEEFINPLDLVDTDLEGVCSPANQPVVKSTFTTEASSKLTPDYHDRLFDFIKNNFSNPYTLDIPQLFSDDLSPSISCTSVLFGADTEDNITAILREKVVENDADLLFNDFVDLDSCDWDISNITSNDGYLPF
ncbi:hypothetical protein AX16_001681 [Volvariella volvacea WC 439]|nr:hypothetical protein AX16_001681 [Volvariella volvacea WC 439]